MTVLSINLLESLLNNMFVRLRVAGFCGSHSSGTQYFSVQQAQFYVPWLPIAPFKAAAFVVSMTQ